VSRSVVFRLSLKINLFTFQAVRFLSDFITVGFYVFTFPGSNLHIAYFVFNVAVVASVRRRYSKVIVVEVTASTENSTNK
jgi:hypothetical protein